MKMVSTFLHLVTATLFTMFSVSAVTAQTVYGVEFESTDWTIKNHAQPSYEAFFKYLNAQNPKGKFQTADFYSAIQIVPQFSAEEGSCSEDSSWIAKFLNGVLGTNTTSLLIVTLTASYNSGGAGNKPFMTEVPLFYAGRGIDPNTNASSSDGCFFNYLNRQNLPYVRHDASTLQDYNLLFRLRAAKVSSSNAVATIKDALVAFAAAFSWTDLTGARVTAMQTAATDFQNGLTRAFSANNTRPVQKSLLSDVGQDNGKNLVWRLKMDTEDGDAHGSMALFVRLSASLILDKHADANKITIGDILSDQDIGTVRCLPELPTPKCTLSPSTFRTALKAYDKDIPVRFFDLRTDDGKKLIYNTCIEIRDLTTGTLYLSTIDALLVRWAAVRLGGLDTALKDTNQAKALAELSGVSVETLVGQCWNKTDEEVLRGVLQNMKVKQVLADE